MAPPPVTPVTTPARTPTPAPPGLPVPTIWKVFWFWKLLAALEAEEDDADEEEEEDCPKTGLEAEEGDCPNTGLFGTKPNEELSEFAEELLEAEEEDELLPEELEVPTNTGLLGSWPGNGLFGLDRKLFKF